MVKALNQLSRSTTKVWYGGNGNTVAGECRLLTYTWICGILEDLEKYGGACGSREERLIAPRLGPWFPNVERTSDWE